jgi:hypothetical protein
MLDVGITLIGFFVMSFAIALLCGLAFHRAGVWTWADPVYYVIAALGVILLFVSNQRTRALADLRSALSTAQQKLTQQQANPPVVDLQNLPPEQQPEQQKVQADRYAVLRQEQKAQEDYINSIRAQITTLNQQDTKSAFQNVLDFIVLHFWPFVLTLGLAIKFARGVAMLRTARERAPQ